MMKIFSKICAFLLAVLLVSIFAFSDARTRFQDPSWYQKKEVKVTNPTIGDDNMESIAQATHKTTNKLNWILQFPKRSDYATPLWYALSLIQISINWILWILATVALVYMLYCGFLVFTSWADDKNAQKGRKWISTAAIALAWIGLSWMIVSAMIRFITMLTDK